MIREDKSSKLWSSKNHSIQIWNLKDSKSFAYLRKAAHFVQQFRQKKKKKGNDDFKSLMIF